MTEDQIKLIIHNLLCGIQYLHENKISHRDINFGNILISDSGKDLKIIDFGVSKDYSEFSTNDNVMLTPCGVPKFRPPECDDISGYTEINDLCTFINDLLK